MLENRYRLVEVLPQLPVDERLAYERLTSSTFYACLLGHHPYGLKQKIVALSVHTLQCPIALALASVNALGAAELFSLYVHPDCRQQGIGTALLKAMEHRLQELGGCVLEMRYAAENAPLESFLQKRGWKDAKPAMKRYYFDAFDFNPAWLKTTKPLPEQLHLFPWTEVTTSQKRRIEAQIEQGRVPEYVDPFREEALIEPLNSLGVRHNEEILGWMVTHRLSTDTIRYSALYAYPEVFKLGVGVNVLKEAIQIQTQSSVQWALFEVNLDQIHSSWHQFVKKRLAPHAITYSLDRKMWRPL